MEKWLSFFIDLFLSAERFITVVHIWVLIIRCVRVDARKATPGELQTVHTEGHVALMQDISSKAYGKLGRRTLQSRYDSIYFNTGSSESALLAAGSVIEVRYYHK